MMKKLFCSIGLVLLVGCFEANNQRKIYKMKTKIFFIVFLFIATMTQATERITMTCKFDALAEGYNSFTVSQKMLLTSPDFYSEFKNKDGSFDDFYWADGHINNKLAFNGIEYMHGTISYGDILFYDGEEWHVLTFDRDDNVLDTEGRWNMNSGNVSCSWVPGWNE